MLWLEVGVLGFFNTKKRWSAHGLVMLEVLNFRHQTDPERLIGCRGVIDVIFDLRQWCTGQFKGQWCLPDREDTINTNNTKPHDLRMVLRQRSPRLNIKFPYQMRMLSNPGDVIEDECWRIQERVFERVDCIDNEVGKILFVGMFLNLGMFESATTG